MAKRPGRIHLAARIIAVTVVLYGLIWVSGFPRQYDDEELGADAQNGRGHQSVPYPVEGDKLVVTIRTTATEAFAKIPTILLLTDPIYHDNLFIVSDLRMKIGALNVEDVLDKFNRNFVQNNPELERYRRQIKFALDSVDLAMLKENDTQKEKEAVALLDKYKYLRMVGLANEFKPDRNWYVFVDADTYLVRSNLVAWLGQYDPSKPYFFANPPELDAAEGPGSGSTTFILSAQAIRELLVDRQNIVGKWDTRIKDFKTGFDVLVATLSTEISLGFNRSWPAISGFHPGTVPYGQGFWCEPVVAMHHVPIEGASDLWNLEKFREERSALGDGPLTFADLWHRFIQPENMISPRDNWDNLASGMDNARWNILFEGIEHHTHATAHSHRDEEGHAERGEDAWEACQQSCNNNQHCVQWSYSSLPVSNHDENGETRCHLSRNMRLGKHVEPQGLTINGKKATLTWKSGWRKDKFEQWAKQQRCKGQRDKK